MILDNRITIDIHGRNVVETMLEGGILDIDAFEWLSQLRYYVNEKSKSVTVKQVWF